MLAHHDYASSIAFFATSATTPSPTKVRTTYPSTDTSSCCCGSWRTSCGHWPRRCGDGRIRLRHRHDPGNDDEAGVPAIGFIAHVDTSPEMSGHGVKPIVHRGWNGTDISLPDAPDAVLRPADIPPLADQRRRRHRHRVWHDAAGRRQQGGRRRNRHGGRVPDAHRKSLTARSASGSRPTRKSGAAPSTSTWRASARCAPTRWTAATRGEVETESFSADAMTVTFHGFNTHPGLRQRPDGERDQGGRELHRPPAARPTVTGDDRRATRDSSTPTS